MQRPLLRMAATWTLVWATSMVLWLWLAATKNLSEAIVGFGASAVAATGLAVVRGKDALVRPRLAWLRPAVALPLVVARYTVTVLGALWRHVVGGQHVRSELALVTIDEPHDETAARSLHLVATVGVSLAPNTFVVGFDRQRGTMLVHQLVPRQPESVKDLLKP